MQMRASSLQTAVIEIDTSSGRTSARNLRNLSRLLERYPDAARSVDEHLQSLLSLALELLDHSDTFDRLEVAVLRLCLQESLLACISELNFSKKFSKDIKTRIGAYQFCHRSVGYDRSQSFA